MKPESAYFLALLRAFLTGCAPDAAQDVDWPSLMSLAYAHKVLPMVVEAARLCPEAQSFPGLQQHKQAAIRQVLLQEQKNAEFLALYDRLLASGLRPLVVKGILCRSLYPKASHRPSSDEDLLVPDPDFEKACAVLREAGMVPTGEASADAFEIGWRKPGSSVYIELHRSLFDPEQKAYGDLNGLLAAAPEHPHPYTVCGKTLYSLNPHDHMLYLLLHAYKHFIHSGFGIRQVCDMGLWAAKYSDQIDWQGLYRLCTATRTGNFAAAVLAIARAQLGINLTLPAPWDALDTDPEPMLRDLLEAGVFGSATPSRQHSATVTLNTVAAQRQAKKASLLGTLFPSRRAMEGRYPVLRRHPYLLPAMWCARMGSYGMELLRSKDRNSAAESLQIARERADLLRKYGIID